MRDKRMIQDYPHAEINAGPEVAPRRPYPGLRAELSRSLASRPVLVVGVCFVLGLLAGGGVALGTLKANEMVRSRRNGRSSEPAPPAIMLEPPSPSAPRQQWTARLLRFPKR